MAILEIELQPDEQAKLVGFGQNSSLRSAAKLTGNTCIAEPDDDAQDKAAVASGAAYCWAETINQPQKTDS